MNKKPVVIGIGELLWDILPSGKKAGGAPINFVYHASQVGAESYAITAVGNDPLGDEILKEVGQAGINAIVERVDYPTGRVLVELKDGIPSYTIIENVAWDHIPLTEPMKEIAGKADAVCFGTLVQRSEESRNTIQTFLSLTPPHAFRIFDINIRQHYYSEEIIVSSLEKSNVLKMNEEELKLLKQLFSLDHLSDENACCWLMEQFNLKFLILTAGDEYSLILDPEDSSFIKTPKVEVVDTVGAGDAFTGAFITAILHGKSMHEAHQLAVDRSAFVCTQPGAWVTRLY